MAQTVSIQDQGNGKYVITDSDGQTRIVGKPIATQEAAKSNVQIMTAKTGTDNTGFTNNASATFPGGNATTTTTTNDGTEASVMWKGKLTPVSEVFKASSGAKELANIRKNLLASGQLTKAEARDPNNLLNKWAQIVTGAANDPEVANRDPFAYAKSLQKSGFVSTTGANQYQNTAYVSSDTGAANTIQNVFNSLLKRNATDAEIKSWTKKLQKAEAANPATYKEVNGVLQYTKPIQSDQWLTDQLMKGSEYLASAKAKATEGMAALQATAMANGLDLNANFAAQLPEWEKAIAAGGDIKAYQTMIRNAARAHLPENVKNTIDPSLDLNSFYAPYINSYAKTFGMDPSQVKISDVEPLALTDKGTLAPIYEFDKKKRSLPNWQYTQEAKTAVNDSIQKVLQDFGFMG